MRSGKRERGFGLVQLLVALVLVAIVSALALAAIDRAKVKALQVKSISNLRQIGIATLAYAADNRGEIPTHISGGAIENSLGINLARGAAPRWLFVATPDLPYGHGSVAYISTPDVFYNDMIEGMRGRSPGRFYLSSGGTPQIGYLFYYWSRRATNVKPSVEGLYNERITDSPNAPIYSEMLTALAETHRFSSDRCAVLYLDGSVHSFRQDDLKKLKSWNAIVTRMTTRQ